MSRKLGAFDPASTASTSVVTETSDFTNLYLTFDNASTDDSSPQNVTVTDVASASYDSTNVAAGSAAILLYEGAGVSYESSSADRLRFQTSDVLLSSNFTIECFFRTTQGGGDVAGRQTIFTYSIYNDARNGYSGLLFWISEGFLKLYASSGSNSWNVFNNQAWGTVSVNTYHHIALTREGNVYRGYFDGARAFESTAGSFHITASASMIGSRDTGGAYTFNGQIDDFRILNGVALHTSSSLTVPTTNVGVNITAATFDTRTHSHVWNYPDIYKARRADTWPAVPAPTRTIQIHVAGGGGGGGGQNAGGDGGDGGVVSVQKTGVTAGTILTYVVGGGGKGGFYGASRSSGQVIGITSGPMAGGGALVASDGDFANPGSVNQSGAEGGAGSGVFLSTATQANAIVIAGGGGGGAGNNNGEGGAGGGQGTAVDSSLLGQDGQGGANQGEGGQSSRGGRHGNGNSPRTTAGALLGQTNIYGGSGYTSGGGGGGGYYGGGGGGHGGASSQIGGAGGGSGYVSSEWTRIESILSLPAGGAHATTGADGGNGKVVIIVDGSTAVSVTSTGTTSTYEVV